jgi:tetratricopeptide (TPR) repeat protein
MSSIFSNADEFYKARNFSEALLYYQEIVVPDDKLSLKLYQKQQLGNCYMMLGQYYKAIDFYNEIISLQENYAVGYANIALCLMQQGKSMDAFHYLIQVRNSNIEFPESQEKILKDVTSQVEAKLIFEPSIFNNWMKDK